MNVEPRCRRIFLVEDHPQMRRGLNLLLNLEPDLEVCGEADDAAEAFRRVCEVRPDLVIVDLVLKGGNGLDLIRQLRAEHPRPRILVLTMHDEVQWIEGARRAGADGYLTKDESATRLIATIHALLESHDKGFSYAVPGDSPIVPMKGQD